MKKIASNTPNVELNQKAFGQFYGAPTVIFIYHRKRIYSPESSFQIAHALPTLCTWMPQVLAWAECASNSISWI